MRGHTKKTTALLLSLLLLTLTLPCSAATLAWGSRGEQLRLVQQKLIQYGYLTGTADGIFGQKTYDAVVLFQRRNGLTVDGRVGPATAAALGITLTGTVSAAAYRETEVEILARLVNGEARGESYKGQVAVGAVILNRVKSSKFPNTIAGVIYQRGAFDAVSDGQIDLEPSDSCLRAARDAMNGYDPTGGCLYYYNPATTTNKWMLSKPVALRIGDHVFCR